MGDEKSLAPLPSGGGSVRIPDEFMEGMSFIRYRMDKDKNLLINDVTGEAKPELLVRIIGVKMERVYLDEGTLVCASRDTKTSKDGVMCEVCPNINNSPLMDSEETSGRYVNACTKACIQNPPPWNTKSKCSLRLVVQWVEEWDKNADGTYTWIQQPGACYLSCGKSSIADMIFRGNGYLSKLRSRGFNDPSLVVTKIKVGTRKNETLKTDYSYETFEMEGKYEDVVAKSTNSTEMKNMGAGSPESLPSMPEKKAELPQAERKVVDEKPASPAAPAQSALPPQNAKEPPPAPPAEAPANTGIEAKAKRMKVNMTFAKLPNEVKDVILGVLKVSKIEELADKDLGVALETLEYAEKEMASQPPAAQTGTAEKKKPW